MKMMNKNFLYGQMLGNLEYFNKDYLGEISLMMRMIKVVGQIVNLL